MLSSIGIRNYKSIQEVELSLGRINVLIGENGAGKSNIEAIALAGASQADKLESEFAFIGRDGDGVTLPSVVLMLHRTGASRGWWR